jgi:hypothetical protein
VVAGGVVGDVEAGGPDDGVGGALGAVAGDDGVGPHLGDAVGDQVDVVLGEGRVPVVGDEDALAADRVVGGEAAAQVEVGDLTFEVGPGDALDNLHAAGVLEPERVQLTGPVDGGAGGLLGGGDEAEQAALAAAQVAVVAGDDPRRGALVDVDVAGDGLDLGHELDGRGAGPDHGDALAGEVVGVVPGRGVEQPAGEGVDPGDVGQPGLRQGAHAPDHDLGGVPGAVAVAGAGGVDEPVPAGGHPPEAGDGGAQPQVGEEVVALGDAAEVGEDLGLGGERP